MAIHFMASLGHSGLGVLIMGVMGLGENGLKVSRYLGCLDVAIFPAASDTIREGMEHVHHRL
jgi:hypothetical protein